MLNKIANLELLIEKAKTLKSKNFKPGYDGMTAAGALLWLQINGERTCRDILKGEYSPTPATAFQTAKKSGGYRKISKLAALDTIVQYAIIDVINSKCEAVFYPESFAYREGKGVGSAIELFRINAGSYRYAAKIDPIGCFDNIDYTVLRSAIIDILNDNKTVDLSLTLTGKELFPTELLDELQEECDYRLLSKDEEIALEDYKISNKPQSYELKNALNGGKLIDGDLVILSDSVFRKIPLPVVARNNLDESKRNLWYEEFVPHETVFWFAVMGSDDDLQTLYETINGKVIQFGGNASIGYGQCLVSRLEG